jgi:NAD+ diphosphatase
VAGYIKNGETLENTAVKEVFEEIGQIVKKIEYISSYYHDKRELLMIGFKCDVEKKTLINQLKLIILNSSI